MFNVLENFKIIKAIGDGSCMFHAILQAFNKTYNSLDYKEKIYMVKEFRKDLSDVLTEKINGKTIYDNLSRGQLKEISKNYSPVSLKNMKKDLKGNKWGDYRFLELLSEILELNIFIVDDNMGNIESKIKLKYMNAKIKQPNIVHTLPDSMRPLINLLRYADSLNSVHLRKIKQKMLWIFFIIT